MPHACVQYITSVPSTSMDEEEQVESRQCTVEPCTIQRGGGVFCGYPKFPCGGYGYNTSTVSLQCIKLVFNLRDTRVNTGQRKSFSINPTQTSIKQ